jgi:hypothetical protein
MMVPLLVVRPSPIPEPEFHSPEPTIEEEHDMDQDTRILEPVPAEHEIRITATHCLDEGDVSHSARTAIEPTLPAGAISSGSRECP